jgi:hypothetical protein
MEKSNPNMWDTSEFFKQLPEVNIDPLGENLVT